MSFKTLILGEEKTGRGGTAEKTGDSRRISIPGKDTGTREDRGVTETGVSTTTRRGWVVTTTAVGGRRNTKTRTTTKRSRRRTKG